MLPFPPPIPQWVAVLDELGAGWRRNRDSLANFSPPLCLRSLSTGVFSLQSSSCPATIPTNRRKIAEVIRSSFWNHSHVLYARRASRVQGRQHWGSANVVCVLVRSNPVNEIAVIRSRAEIGNHGERDPACSMPLLNQHASSLLFCPLLLLALLLSRLWLTIFIQTWWKMPAWACALRCTELSSVATSFWTTRTPIA